MTRFNDTQTIPIELTGKRLDQVLAKLFPDFSRSRLQQWLKEGHIKLNGNQAKARLKVMGGEQVTLDVELESDEQWEAQDIPLNIVYEDDHILVVNKPAGMVVHPAAGNRNGTMLNALLHHEPRLREVPRAGIVHRLDKDTTGLLVVAKTLPAQTHLVNQLQHRAFERFYQAIVQGHLISGGTVNEPLGRHPKHRTKIAVIKTASGKEAITHYRVMEQFGEFTQLQLKLETGRTHQIRVHMAHIGHPIVGDPLYGGRQKMPKGASDEFKQYLKSFSRQALHAARLGLEHPHTGKWMSWKAPLPDDMQQLLASIAENAGQQYQEQSWDDVSWPGFSGSANAEASLMDLDDEWDDDDYDDEDDDGVEVIYAE